MWHVGGARKEAAQPSIVGWRGRLGVLIEALLKRDQGQTSGGDGPCHIEPQPWKAVAASTPVSPHPGLHIHESPMTRVPLPSQPSHTLAPLTLVQCCPGIVHR